MKSFYSIVHKNVSLQTESLLGSTILIKSTSLLESYIQNLPYSNTTPSLDVINVYPESYFYDLVYPSNQLNDIAEKEIISNYLLNPIEEPNILDPVDLSNIFYIICI